MRSATVIELVAAATTVSARTGQRDVKVRLSACVSDGRDVTLLDDRGFSVSINPRSASMPEPGADDLISCAWCVGPEEAFDDHTSRTMADDHFGALAADLAASGIETTAVALMTTRFRAVWGDLQRVWPEGFDWY